MDHLPLDDIPMLVSCINFLLREPAFDYALLLLVHFQNTHDQPDPPAFLAQIVFHLNDGRMADADTKEHGRAYEFASKVDIYCGMN